MVCHLVEFSLPCQYAYLYISRLLAFSSFLRYQEIKFILGGKMAKLETRTDDVMDNIPYYEKWQRGEGIPTNKTFFIQDLKEVPLSPWDRIGGDGVFINMEGAGQATGAYLCEIAAGKSLKPQKHLYEELLLVVKGRGATTVWNDKGAKQTFEWQEGSLLSIPLNVWHQHFNGQGNEPARFFSVNNMPIIFSLFHNSEFIFNTPYDFTDRFNGEDQYFSGKGISHPRRIWETNFIADTRSFNLQEWKERGGGRQKRHARNGGRGNGRSYFRVSYRNLQEGAPPRPWIQRNHYQGARVLLILARGRAHQTI